MLYLPPKPFYARCLTSISPHQPLPRSGFVLPPHPNVRVSQKAGHTRRSKLSNSVTRPCPPCCPIADIDQAVHGSSMTKYLISFPSEAMQLTAQELTQAAIDAHAVIEEAKAAGVYVFGGGIDEGVVPVLVASDGSMMPETYPGSHLNGGFTVLELPTRQDAVEWATKIAVACRCSQELRQFMYDSAS